MCFPLLILLLKHGLLSKLLRSNGNVNFIALVGVVGRADWNEPDVVSGVATGMPMGLFRVEDDVDAIDVGVLVDADVKLFVLCTVFNLFNGINVIGLLGIVGELWVRLVWFEFIGLGVVL